ncbi:AzlD domain-containing protein [Dielma fastidiosa]|uniref:AzlD domain-containing protein n=1 Tax=Dielma fastidiosa TaxID=1034346 RepID=UPI000EC49A78|nr:AzlD domain-containing protein [Dielma fastidiosa]HAH93827.1 branched-chain amino acid transporter [Dielma fastidiosa]
MNRILISIVIMAVTTYLIRMLPMVLCRKKIENQFIQSFLYYVPYAVLAAMTFPDIFTSTRSLASASAGCLAALWLAYKKRSLLIVAIGAVITVYLAEWLIGI